MVRSRSWLGLGFRLKRRRSRIERKPRSFTPPALPLASKVLSGEGEEFLPIAFAPGLFRNLFPGKVTESLSTMGDVKRERWHWRETDLLERDESFLSM